MEINKKIMEKETTRILSTLFTLPVVDKIFIKDVKIDSIYDGINIKNGIEKCYHDNYSDVDLIVWIKLNPKDYIDKKVIFKSLYPGLKLENVLGISFAENIDKDIFKGVIRVCLKSGFRMDFSYFVRLDDNAPVLPNECTIDFFEDQNLVNAYDFWFVAILALGKLMRKDYLIADHLVHKLLMEGLVIQMIIRDNQYHTNFHRYGYKEKLEYIDADISGVSKYQIGNDDTYNHIVTNLYRAVDSYDYLVSILCPLYKSRKNEFFDIWLSYKHIEKESGLDSGRVAGGCYAEGV